MSRKEQKQEYHFRSLRGRRLPISELTLESQNIAADSTDNLEQVEIPADLRHASFSKVTLRERLSIQELNQVDTLYREQIKIIALKAMVVFHGNNQGQQKFSGNEKIAGKISLEEVTLLIKNFRLIQDEQNKVGKRLDCLNNGVFLGFLIQLVGFDQNVR